MKKFESIFLAIILCLNCFAFTLAEEVDGQSVIMDYIGTYDDIGTHRAVMTIEAIGQEEPYAHIVIRWSNSAEEYVEWDLSGLLDPETMTIVCMDGTKSLCTVNEAGNVTAVAENINIDSEFVIHEDESITWIDHVENVGENSRFVFSDGAWSFNDTAAEQQADQ